MSVADTFVQLLQSGASSLASYLAAHVLLCLVPAFFIAGAMTALVPKSTITRYLGPAAPKRLAYPMAAVGGFVLAVCSCTILPLFAGIFAKGAGLGAAITFLFVGPSINILAVSYTGVAIGMDIAIARIVLSVGFGIIIGLIMAYIFRRQERARQEESQRGGILIVDEKLRPAVATFMLLLLAVLIVGTLGVDLFRDVYAEFTVSTASPTGWQASLDRLVPYDADKGEEGVSLQGLALIGMLGLIGATAWPGLNTIDEAFNGWSWLALGFIGLTLLVAALSITPQEGGLVIGITGRFIGMVLVLMSLGLVAWKGLEPYEVQEWLWETWRFVKQIFPLLIVGVFLAGMVRVIIPPSLIESIAGENTLLANLAGVLFGVFMYFPTLVEVPIANMFLSLGMHKGPLLAYLIADPALSIQSILITASIIGRRRTWVYVALVTVFATLSGLIFGWFVG
jgi:uncharacterized membrane protein YraQ (UPF0718 family)